jgi:hypothetical protein
MSTHADEPQPPRLRPTHEHVEAYRAAYAYFNKALFAGELPDDVLLSFSRADTSAAELNLNPVYLVNKPSREAAALLVHEMCHVWRLQNGEPPRRGYHDRPWAEKMLSLGLTPSDTDSPGGKTTGVRMTTHINRAGAFANAFAALPDAHLLRWRAGKGAPAKRADPSKTKYTCGCSNAWGKPGLEMQCLRCGNRFTLVEGE